MIKIKWDEVFKIGPSKICGRQPLKNLKVYGLLEQYHFKFLKDCLPQFLLGPFLNTLSQMKQQQMNNFRYRRFCVYTGIYGSQKADILAFFMHCN